MKTARILKLMGIVLTGLLLTTQVEAIDLNKRSDEKKTIKINVDKPIIEIMVKAFADQINAKEIARIQKVLDQIDHITISFCDKDACDYVLKFKPLDNNGLEDWMFIEGYLTAAPEPEPMAIEPWMLDPEYLK